MKYYSKLKLYKASNVTFDPIKMDARSYQWWSFVTKVGNKIVFNDFKYSNTTLKHQYKVKRLMQDLGIKIDHFVKTRIGLQNTNWQEDAVRILNYEIKSLKELVNKKGTRKVKNQERLYEILRLEAKTLEIWNIRGDS